MISWWLIPLALVCNLPVGYLALRKQSLTVPGGLLAAGLLGVLLFIIQPLYWVLLLVFFGSSTLLTRFREDDPLKQDALSLAEKSGKRDPFQVLANGGIPLLLALVGLAMEQVIPVQDLASGYSLGVAISFAVVNADTWATELGVTSTDDPYWILNPTRRVPRGTSGGVSPRGLLASILASALVATVYGVATLITTQFSWIAVLLITGGGLLGSLLDSVLGATVQAQYHCSSCQKLTEQPVRHRCGTATTMERGLSWFSNDLVNLGSALVATGLILAFLG